MSPSFSRYLNTFRGNIIPVYSRLRKSLRCKAGEPADAAPEVKDRGRRLQPGDPPFQTGQFVKMEVNVLFAGETDRGIQVFLSALSPVIEL